MIPRLCASTRASPSCTLMTSGRALGETPCVLPGKSERSRHEAFASAVLPGATFILRLRRLYRHLLFAGLHPVHLPADSPGRAVTLAHATGSASRFHLLACVRAGAAHHSARSQIRKLLSAGLRGISSLGRHRAADPSAVAKSDE